MSQERVEALRSSFEAWNRGDVDAWLALAHPDIEFRTSGVFPGTDSIYRGHVGLRRFWTSFREPWESLHVRVGQIRDLGDEIVLLGTFEGHARDGMSVEREAAWIFGGYVDDLALRVEGYGTWKEAFEAVRLAE